MTKLRILRATINLKTVNILCSKDKEIVPFNIPRRFLSKETIFYLYSLVGKDIEVEVLIKENLDLALGGNK